jgi:hypothetical protein
MTIFRFSFVVSVAALIGSCGATPTDAQQWSQDWSDPSPEVAIALAKNSVRGCGEFYQKENAEYPGEFAVACNRMPDGSGRAAWVAYQVWIPSEKVLGPDLTAVHMKFGGPPRPDPR